MGNIRIRHTGCAKTPLRYAFRPWEDKSRLGGLSLVDPVGQKIEQLNDLEKRVRKILREGAQIKNLRDLALDGREVMDFLGLLPGPEVGRTLELLMERVEENPELNTKNRLRIILKEMRGGIC